MANDPFLLLPALLAVRACVKDAAVIAEHEFADTIANERREREREKKRKISMIVLVLCWFLLSFSDERGGMPAQTPLEEPHEQVPPLSIEHYQSKAYVNGEKRQFREAARSSKTWICNRTLSQVQQGKGSLTEALEHGTT